MNLIVENDNKHWYLKIVVFYFLSKNNSYKKYCKAIHIKVLITKNNQWSAAFNTVVETMI